MAEYVRREIFMSIPAKRGEVEESFEERRVSDYINAFQTTGRPPAPSPPEPIDAAQRAALGLPRLFEPHIEIVTSQAGAHGHANGVPAVNLDTQLWRPMQVPGESVGDVLQSIVCQPEYGSFSFEELRLSAYRRGSKYAALPPRPHIVLPIASNLVNGITDKLQSISCAPTFEKHSFEELRLAFIRVGRELTSVEIVQKNDTLRLA